MVEEDSYPDFRNSRLHWYLFGGVRSRNSDDDSMTPVRLHFVVSLFLYNLRLQLITGKLTK